MPTTKFSRILPSLVRLVSGCFIMIEFGIKTSPSSKVLMCVVRKLSAIICPVNSPIVTVSFRLKCRLNARMIPPKKISAMSLKAKPKIKADIPAPASKPPAIPLSHNVCKTRMQPQIMVVIFAILLINRTNNGSCLHRITYF